MANRYYIKYSISYDYIRELIKRMNKRRVNFFIDLQSICKGFYNEQTVFFETKIYVEQGTYSNQLIQELKDFLNPLYSNFKEYDPYFIIFYDDGINSQNMSIMSSYKEDRHNGELDEYSIEEKNSKIMQKNIKKYYFNEIPRFFIKENVSDVYYIPELETDFIPHYCIMNNIYDSRDNDVLNIIFSVDKDLLQTCKFNNTIQYINCYKPSIKEGSKSIMEIYDRYNAVKYIYKTYKKNILRAEHIPLILAIGGDHSDSIPSLEFGCGIGTAIKMIENYNIPINYWEIEKNKDKMPKLIKDNLLVLKRNLSLIDFEMQISRIKKEISPLKL